MTAAPIETSLEEAGRFRSSAATHTSAARRRNEDSFVNRPDLGLWAVADGLGGLSQGEVASQMVCGVLASLVPSATLEGTIEDIRRSLDEVNTNLYRASQRPLDPVQSCSTLVALALREQKAAVLWAGDSRAYRLRGGKLERLTADHSEEPPAPDLVVVAGSDAGKGTPAVNSAVTRAVGGTETLELDLRIEPTEPGDRFLLCSDGVTRALDDGRLLELLTAKKDPESCVRELLSAANGVPADDNVTAVVIDI